MIQSSRISLVIGTMPSHICDLAEPRQPQGAAGFIFNHEQVLPSLKMKSGLHDLLIQLAIGFQFAQSGGQDSIIKHNY